MGFVLCCVRIVVALGFRAQKGLPMTPKAALRWRASYVAPTFVYCCLIAYVTRYTFLRYPIVGSRISMIGTFCIAAAMYARAGMRPWVMNCCGWLMLGNLAWLVWEKHGAMTMPAAALILFFAYQNAASAQIQFHIVVEQLRSREKLRRLAEQDALTGLANRRHFEASFKALCSKAQPFAILSIDLDRFKKVNDTLGHAAGDELLVQVAKRLSLTLRETDLLARLGGDEFRHPCNTPLDSMEAGTRLAERINRTIADAFNIEGQTVEIGASVGLRLFSPGDTDPNLILRKVDNALYRVKQAGGGSFCLADG